MFCSPLCVLHFNNFSWFVLMNHSTLTLEKTTVKPKLRADDYNENLILYTSEQTFPISRIFINSQSSKINRNSFNNQSIISKLLNHWKSIEIFLTSNQQFLKLSIIKNQSKYFWQAINNFSNYQLPKINRNIFNNQSIIPKLFNYWKSIEILLTSNQ